MLKKNIVLPLAVVTLFGLPVWAQDTEIVETNFKPFLAEVSDNNPEREVAVNLRGGDGINYKILSVYTEGRRLVVRGSQGDWLQVEPVDGRLPVWVKSSFFNLNRDKATCTGDRIVMRAGATTKSASLGVVSKGDVLTVLKTVGNWTQVEAPKGTLAWISSKYVQKVAGDWKAMVMTTSEEESSEAGESVETAENPAGMAPELPEGDTEQDKENKETAQELEKLRQEFEARLEELQKKRATELGTVDELAGENDYTATGQLKLTKDKASYELELGGRTTYKVRSALNEDKRPVLDLELFEKKTIGVVGRIVELKDGSRVIEVSKVTLLDSPK